ncbi:esterase/lipase family protein [Bradyrhizobium sp. USDA 336]|uniref:esterase/lipase family protein n=1 Tax=Bradyrhizobium sp. USDA 336 TaxID=3156311 RepID=UPI0038398CF6
MTNAEKVRGFQPWHAGPAEVLAVVLHGWGGSPMQMSGVIEATKSAFSAEGVDIYAPPLPYAFRLRSVRSAKIIVDLLDAIDEIVRQRGDVRRIVFIGFSLGGVFVRRLFLLAAGDPPGFEREPAFNQVAPRDWSRKVERLVTISAFNRGWHITGRTDWYSSFILNLLGLIGHLSPSNWQPTAFDARRGAPFIAQTRLHWLAFRRWHAAIRAHAVTGNDLQRPVSLASDPIVVQLVGRQDSFTSPLDLVDIVVDGRDASAPPGNRRYFYIEMPNTDHAKATRFSNTPDGQVRQQLFVAALTQPDFALDLIASDPSLLADDIPQVDTSTTDVVFVMHGIRDDGFWTHHIAKEVRQHAAGSASLVQARTPSYGYFAMLPFILPWVRRQKVDWFMDEYVAAIARFPNAAFSYVGHSNGTYLAARALVDYAATRFKHVFFAGSVVRSDYDWLSILRAGRIVKLHNVPAAADWVVALFPKSVEHWPKFDLGSAGFDGFVQAGRHPNITQPCDFANGQHSAAIVESQWPHIAKFIIQGDVPPSLPASAFVKSRAAWLVPLARSHLGLPLLILIFGVAVPALMAIPLLQYAIGVRPIWLVDRLEDWQTIALSFAFIGYFALLKFVVTRV